MDSWNLGPIDKRVLYDQINHVSNDVYDGKDRGKLTSSQLTEQVYDKWNLTKAQKNILDKCGFGIFKHVAVVHQTDIGLVSALMERWRLETNTFYLNCGKITITLEDIHFIFRLPVAGKPLTCPAFETKVSHFRDCFGPELASQHQLSKKRGSISLVWLQEQFLNFPGRASKEVVGQYTKAYILWLCGAILFPTRSKNSVHPRYMCFLANIEDCVMYSWGAALLGYLYRALYTASRKGVKYINGCVTLLQIWAYERLVVRRPNHKPQSEFWLPRATTWAYSTTHSYPSRRNNPHHHLTFYRGELDGQPSWQVVWRPYMRWDDDFNGYNFEERLLGSARIPLIHFDIVEYQLPDWVMRQFGFLQGIPSPAENHDDLRKPKENRFNVTDCMALREAYIAHWEAYIDHLEGQQYELANYVSIDDYMDWYGRIIRRTVHHQRPEGDEDPTYEPRAIYNQHHLINMVESAKSLLDKCFAFMQMPLEYKLEKQGWDHH